MRKLWLFMIGIAFSINVVAKDVQGASDYPYLERFPTSYIDRFKQLKPADYRLILGSVEKINGVLRPEGEKRLEGDLTQISYRIPSSRSPDEVFEHFYTQILSQGGQELFRCKGRDCGSSNLWANQIFGYSRLYGLDDWQSFASFKLREDYISLYAIKRGNKRIYLHLEVLTPKPSTLQSRQSQTAHFSWKMTSEKDLSELIQLLQQQPELSLWIVAYDFNAGTKQQQLRRSLMQAQELQAQLIAAGIKAGKITLHGAGSFTLGEEKQQGTQLWVYTEGSRD